MGKIMNVSMYAYMTLSVCVCVMVIMLSNESCKNKHVI